MGRLGKKPIQYVCCAIVGSRLVSEAVVANTLNDAAKKFKLQYGCKPEDIHGPFFSKRPTAKDKVREYEFEGKSKKAIYDGWFVTALMIKDQKNCAFLLFDSRVDGQKMQRPQGDFIVKLDELKDLQ